MPVAWSTISAAAFPSRTTASVATPGAISASMNALFGEQLIAIRGCQHDRLKDDSRDRKRRRERARRRGEL